jgi:hypothetical protein
MAITTPGRIEARLGLLITAIDGTLVRSVE